jgi:hypothetical protein
MSRVNKAYQRHMLTFTRCRYGVILKYETIYLIPNAIFSTIFTLIFENPHEKTPKFVVQKYIELLPSLLPKRYLRILTKTWKSHIYSVPHTQWNVHVAYFFVCLEVRSEVKVCAKALHSTNSFEKSRKIVPNTIILQVFRTKFNVIFSLQTDISTGLPISKVLKKCFCETLSSAKDQFSISFTFGMRYSDKPKTRESKTTERGTILKCLRMGNLLSFYCQIFCYIKHRWL